MRTLTSPSDREGLPYLSFSAASKIRIRLRKNFLACLESIVKEYPNQRLYVVLDNLNTHSNEAARKWLEAHRLVSFHYTPTTLRG